MKKIVNTYKRGVRRNLDDIHVILKSLNMDAKGMMPAYKQVFNMSSQNITNKWLTGRKYARTYFAQKAFGKYYPKKYSELSLIIDAMVNILDDLVDEKMEKKERGVYVSELGRVLALFNLDKPEKKIQVAIGHYFNKLITLAVAENIYLELIKKDESLENIIKYSAGLLICRAQDIDIFNEIALIKYGSKSKMNIMKIGRMFRAINILKKDIKDIEYDKKNNMESAITHMLDRKDQDFSSYINGLSTYFRGEANKVAIKVKKDNIKLRIPVDNFYKMIKSDIKEINKMVK